MSYNSLRQLRKHARDFESANREFIYDENRSTRLFYLYDDDNALNRFRRELLEALNGARKDRRPLPAVITSHSMRDVVEVVNGDTLLNYLEPYAFRYAIIVEFKK